MNIINLTFFKSAEIMDLEIVEKYNPYHGKDGRFTSAGGAASFTIRTRDGAKQGLANAAIDREKASDISQHTMEHGGMSVRLKTYIQPKDGYMCAVYKDRAEWISAEDAKDSKKRTALIKSYMERNADVLAMEGNHLGTWRDPDTGNISLDVSRRFKNMADAIAFAESNNEKAIFDVANLEDIPTGGTGNNLGESL